MMLTKWRVAVRRAAYSLLLTSVEAFIAVLSIMTGAPILFKPESLAPGSVVTLLPGWSLYLWAGGLVVGGALSLLGIVMSEYRIERSGVLALSATTSTYAVALFGLLPQSFYTLVTFIFFSLAMWARYWVLGKNIQIQNAVIHALIKEVTSNTKRRIRF